MLRAVGFDLWETLITDTPEVARQQEAYRLAEVRAILDAEGHVHDAAAIDHAYHELWNRCHDLYWSADRDIPTRQQILHFLEVLDLDHRTLADTTLERLEHVYAVAALEILPALVPGAAAVVQRLESEGYAIGIISNTGRTPGSVLRNVLEQLGLAPHVDALVFSNEHGECKPRPSIFARLCEQLGAEPHEVVFVGDNLYCDVHGAQQCGMMAVHFNPAVRGLAVAPPTMHRLEIVPDETIVSLDQLPETIAALRSRRAFR